MERISVIKGFGRMFSPKSLMELVKALGKFFLVATVACLVLMAVLDDILRLPLLPLAQAFQETGYLFIWCLLGFSSILILVAMMDVPFQLFEFKKQIRMTKQEVKEEMKDTEGRPEVKGAIREKQQQMAQQRMMSEVPTADVIITNPTHYAVALRYDQDSNGAPRVVAKGKDFIAQRIREIAEENEVAIFRAPPLARALYGSTDLNQEIPGNLFMAVAQVLAYIFQLRQARKGRGRRPTPPGNIKVPAEYTRRELEEGKP
jgi:flagellar biosynthetic protein FlhB